MAFVTAVRISPAKSDLTIPKMVYLENAQFLMSKVYPSTGKFIGGATIQYGTAGRPFQKKFRVFETPNQILVAQNSTDINAQDKKTAQTAAGSTQGTALAITNYFTEVSSAAASTGVVLDASTKGKVRVVLNDGANAINVYPAVGETISGNSVNTPIVLAVGARVHLACFTAGTWVVAVAGN